MISLNLFCKNEYAKLSLIQFITYYYKKNINKDANSETIA